MIADTLVSWYAAFCSDDQSLRLFLTYNQKKRPGFVFKKIHENNNYNELSKNILMGHFAFRDNVDWDKSDKF